MSKKLLALDIDGTLTNTQKDITPATLEKIIEAQEKGNIVAIASGRPLPGIRKIADTIELDRFGGYVLAFNGGRIVDYSTGEVVYQAVLDNDVEEERRMFYVGMTRAKKKLHLYSIEQLNHKNTDISRFIRESQKK